MNETHAARPVKTLRARNGEMPLLLLAEDSTTARILTATLLRHMGCAVDEAEHGEEALEAIIARPYHAVILDIEMPVMDGITAARAIRSLPNQKAKTPLIALSAFLADSSGSSHWHSLFDLTHPKPASREGLQKAVAAMLDLHFEVVPEIEPHVMREGYLDEIAITNLKSQFSLLDWEILIHSAMTEMQESLIAMRDAQAQNDLQSLSRTSHKMKGLARSFAALALANQAEGLEIACKINGDIAPSMEQLQHCVEKTILQLRAA